MSHMLTCSECGKAFPDSTLAWRCDCGGFFDLEIDACFDKTALITRKPHLWRYRELLPLHSDENRVSFGEGFTPLLRVDFSGKKVWCKVEYLFPTGSFKDRGATVLISKLKELGIKAIIEDSSGNAGCSIAAYAAHADIRCSIYVPERTGAAKSAQIEIHGAQLVKVSGDRSETAEAAILASKDIYYASHVWNPYFLQGTKTFAFEIWEQMDFRPPDSVIIPVGNGTLLLGAYKGFDELKKLGLSDRIPRLIAVQSERCAPLMHEEQGFSKSTKQKSIAEGIAVTNPVRKKHIIDAITQTEGTIITVSDDEIHQAFRIMGRKGFYIEMTAAAGIAGVIKYCQTSPSSEKIVTALTGHGLKSDFSTHCLTHPILPVYP